MAILIKEFKMQETCYDCPFCDHEFGKCLADVEERYTEDYGIISPRTYGLYGEINQKLLSKRCGHGPGKPEWCPLAEVEK